MDKSNSDWSLRDFLSGNVSENISGQELTTQESSTSMALTYHELQEVPVQNEDLLVNLKNNLDRLQTSQDRLHFLLKEIKYLLKA